MAKTNLQRWIAYMKKTLPGSASESFPAPTSGDAGKILSVDEGGNPVWVEPGGGGIPLGENESICIFKD